MVFVFAVENARLPQGEEGRGLLPEPGRPHAVLQVSARPRSSARPAVGGFQRARFMFWMTVAYRTFEGYAFRSGAVGSVSFSALLFCVSNVLIPNLLRVDNVSQRFSLRLGRDLGGLVCMLHT